MSEERIVWFVVIGLIGLIGLMIWGLILWGQILFGPIDFEPIFTWLEDRLY